MRTLSSGKVELGAFRTYPEGHKSEKDAMSEYQSIPISKIEDFGVNANQYYMLDVSYFKSSLDTHLFDLLWNKYWVSTLSSSVLHTNRSYITGQIQDLSEKLDQAETQLAHSGRMGSFEGKKKDETQLSKLTKDASKVGMEQISGIMSQVIKDNLFNLNVRTY